MRNRIAWLLAVVGVVLFAVGAALQVLLIAIVGAFYLVPLSLLYIVLTSANRRDKYIGMLVSLALLAFSLAASYQVVFCELLPGGTCPPPGISLELFLPLGIPSVLLLAGSLIRIFKKQ